MGRPLPWAIHDRHGKLLLRQGEVIRSEDLLRAVMERGLVQEAAPSRERERIDAVAAVEVDLRKLPVFRRVLALQERQERALVLLRDQREGALQACSELARDVHDACQQDIDAALAAFQLEAADEIASGALRGLHCAVLCALMARPLGLDAAEREALLGAALTHDIGMHPLADALNRQRVALSAEQRAALAGHADAGGRLLEQAGAAQAWIDAVLQHHERIDGSGYPRGLKGDQISRLARVVAISDIYSAMIRPRAYREAVQSREVLRQLFLERGRWVDESVAAGFIRDLGVYPPGTLVRLDNNQVAVVIRRGETAAAPRLRLLVGADGAAVSRSSRPAPTAAIVGVVPLQRFRALSSRLPELWDESAEAVA